MSKLSGLLNSYFGKSLTRKWLFAHDKKTATMIIKFAIKRKRKMFNKDDLKH
jgi:hypothetical protein